MQIEGADRESKSRVREKEISISERAELRSVSERAELRSVSICSDVHGSTCSALQISIFGEAKLIGDVHS